MSKIIFKDGLFTYNSIQYPFTNCSFNKTASVIDVTDQDTDDGEKEFVFDKRDSDFTLEIWTNSSLAIPTIGGTSHAFTILSQHVNYIGSAICVGMSESMIIETAIKIQFTFKVNGSVTRTYV